MSGVDFQQVGHTDAGQAGGAACRSGKDARG